MAKSKLKGLKALRNKVIVTNIDSGAKLTKAGIIVLDDEGVERGIRPRWAEVVAVGDDVDDIKPGEWILVSHGRWTRGIPFIKQDGSTITVRGVEYPDGVLLAATAKPKI